LKEENIIVNALWVGKSLSMIELLTLYSFTYHGHTVNLWTYNGLITPLPPDVIRKDANLIIPERDIFYKKHLDPIAGVGEKSIGAPFSDLFRYKLLYEQGGWWIDMDVTCLKPLDISEPYFFRDHLILDVIGNVMKCPKGSELMKRTYYEVKEKCDENTVDWLLPNKILNKHIHELGLMKYKQADVSNRDEWDETKRYIRGNIKIPENWLVIHWTNEEFRMNRIDKNNLRLSNTTLGLLIAKFRVPVRNQNILRMIRNEIILINPVRKTKEFMMKIIWFFYSHIVYYFKDEEEKRKMRGEKNLA